MRKVTSPWVTANRSKHWRRGLFCLFFCCPPNGVGMECLSLPLGIHRQMSTINAAYLMQAKGRKKRGRESLYYSGKSLLKKKKRKYTKVYYFCRAAITKYQKLSWLETTEMYCQTTLESRAPNQGIAKAVSLWWLGMSVSKSKFPFFGRTPYRIRCHPNDHILTGWPLQRPCF